MWLLWIVDCLCIFLIKNIIFLHFVYKYLMSMPIKILRDSLKIIIICSFLLYSFPIFLHNLTTLEMMKQAERNSDFTWDMPIVSAQNQLALDGISFFFVTKSANNKLTAGDSYRPIWCADDPNWTLIWANVYKRRGRKKPSNQPLI